ncbi:MAG: alpha/beta hydrolase [Bacteroidota bacterium]
MKKLFPFVPLLLLLCGCTDMSSIKNKHLNVSYANDSKAQQMDIFIPDGDGPSPTVILIHGGGFKTGDKKSENDLAKALVSNGFVAIAVNYRLSGEAVFPAAVHDVKAAIRFIRANAKKYVVDPDKIATWGASAGGHLSAMMGTSAGDGFLDGIVGDHNNESAQIQACINWFGPINFATMIDDARQLGFDDRFNVTIESAYLGADATDPINMALVQRSNPTNYIDETDPPFYVQAGSKDPLIPYLQSQNFADTLRKVLGDGKVNYELIENAKHGGSKFTDQENVAKIISFLDKHLKK